MIGVLVLAEKVDELEKQIKKLEDQLLKQEAKFHDYKIQIEYQMSQFRTFKKLK